MVRCAWAGTIAALVLALGLAPVGCGEEGGGLATYMLSGTLTSTTAAASGSWGHVRLVASGGAIADAAAFKARCQLSGPSCPYQINQVLEGEYTVYALVDLDGDAALEDPQPDSGDLVSPGRPLIMLGWQRMDFPDNAWRTMP